MYARKNETAAKKSVRNPLERNGAVVQLRATAASPLTLYSLKIIALLQKSLIVKNKRKGK